VRIRLLGPLEVDAGGGQLALGRRRERLLFGLLALEAGRWVPTQSLCLAVFGDSDDSDTQRSALRVGISRLRRVLSGHGVPIASTDNGLAYLLDVPPDWVDAETFRILTREGRSATAAPERAAILAQALGLWRGGVLDGDVSTVERPGLALELTTLRAQALEWRWSAEIDCGRDADAVAALRPLVAADPTNEPLTALLMIALCRTGHTADALSAYAHARETIAERLGVDPGPRLDDLHVRILRGERVGPATGREGVTTPPPPNLLPRSIPHFVGRTGELAQLSALAQCDEVPITILAGAGGLGKTALAVYWGRLNAHRYPDAQLFLDLHGFGPHGSLTPSAAVAALLGAIGVPPEAVPVELDRAAAELRGRLAAKRVLMVLDNAESADQIRPLIPSGPGSAVVVTSRNRLAGLTMSHGAVRIDLAHLAPDESIAIMRTVVGNARIDRDPVAAEHIAELCAGLPLAVRLAAAVVDARHDLTLREYADQTRQRVLDGIEIADDVGSSLRAVLGYSFQALPPPQRRLMLLLAVSVGADLTVPAIAAIAGVTEREVGPRVEELCSTFLLEERRFGRFSMHALTRAFVLERLTGHPEPERTAARSRLLGYYIHTADNASVTCADAKLKLPRDPVPAGVTPTDFDTGAVARSWLRAETHNLVAEADGASRVGPLPAAWQLADALHTYFWTHREPGPWHLALEAGIRAATSAGDDAVLANMLVRRGSVYWVFAEHEAAERLYDSALAVNERIGRRLGVAGVHQSLAALYVETGRLAAAKASAELADRLYEELGRDDQRAFTLALLGHIELDLGDPRRAIDLSLRAAELHRTMGMKQALAAPLLRAASAFLALEPPELDRARLVAAEALAAASTVESHVAIAAAHGALGRIEAGAGRYGEAMAHIDRAMAHASDSQHRVSECLALLARGQVRWLCGEPADADFGAAVSMAKQINYPQATVQGLIGLAECGVDPVRHLTEAAELADRHGLVALHVRSSQLLGARVG
jgi:DNA-binding SARP family transcriptional activator/tetratricopeptide (TPR) repeat protein